MNFRIQKRALDTGNRFRVPTPPEMEQWTGSLVRTREKCPQDTTAPRNPFVATHQILCARLCTQPRPDRALQTKSKSDSGTKSPYPEKDSLSYQLIGSRIGMAKPPSIQHISDHVVFLNYPNGVGVCNLVAFTASVCRVDIARSLVSPAGPIFPGTALPRAQGTRPGTFATWGGRTKL